MSIPLPKIEAVFKEQKTYAATASVIGITRQAVDQRLKRSIDPQVVAIKSTWSPQSPACTVCFRRWSKTVMHTKNDICKMCRAYNQRVRSGTRVFIRSVLYPKQCTTCEKALIKGKRAKGMCINCYESVYRRTPRRREKQRAYRLKAYYKYHEKSLLKNKKYYYANRERLLKYQKERNKRLSI